MTTAENATETMLSAVAAVDGVRDVSQMKTATVTVVCRQPAARGDVVERLNRAVGVVDFRRTEPSLEAVFEVLVEDATEAETGGETWQTDSRDDRGGEAVDAARGGRQ